MIDYNANIVSGKSIGDFHIGNNINNYTNDLYKKGVSLTVSMYNENKKNEIHSYLIDSKIKINTLADGEIINITSLKSYEGLLDGLVKSGMTVKQIKENSKRQNINHGCLFLNGDYGFCYILPSPYDEIADTIGNLPDDLVLDEICVGNFTWWFKPELTPKYAK